MRAVAVLTLALTLTACPARTPVIDGTKPPSRTASPAPSPEPTPTRKAAPKALRAAYVAEEGLYLYDVAKDAVQEVLRGTSIKQPRFLNRDTIGFLRDEGGGTTVLTYDIRTRALETLLTTEDEIKVWTMRPDNEEIAYVVTGADAYPQVRFRALVGNQTTLVVTTLARAWGREFDLSDQMYLRYSPDGARAVISFTPADGEPGQEIPDSAAQLQVRRADGALSFAPPQAQEATQAVMSWDGRKVFFRSTRGARFWDAATGATATVRGSPPVWFDIAASIDGRTIAYDTGATSGKVRVEVLDVRNGERRQVGPAGRVSPVYASTRTLWTQIVQPCEPECLYPVVPGPEVYAVDLRTGTERRLKLPTLQQIAVFYA